MPGDVERRLSVPQQRFAHQLVKCASAEVMILVQVGVIAPNIDGWVGHDYYGRKKFLPLAALAHRIPWSCS
jgi:hypothetical protein